MPIARPTHAPPPTDTEPPVTVPERSGPRRSSTPTTTDTTGCHEHPQERNEVTTLQLTALLDAFMDPTTQASVPDVPCQVHDAELWFAESPADVEFAKTLCQDCPVKADCLAGALDRAEPWGVWGGELFLSGVVIPRKRPRGRPRKVEIAA